MARRIAPMSINLNDVQVICLPPASLFTCDFCTVLRHFYFLTNIGRVRRTVPFATAELLVFLLMIYNVQRWSWFPIDSQNYLVLCRWQLCATSAVASRNGIGCSVETQAAFTPYVVSRGVARYLALRRVPCERRFRRSKLIFVEPGHEINRQY